MRVREETAVPLGNAKTAVPSNHHTKTNNSDNSFYISDSNLASLMSCLFVILSSLSLARVGANQYTHYGTRPSQIEVLWMFEKLSNKISISLSFSFLLYVFTPTSPICLLSETSVEGRKKNLIQKHSEEKKNRKKKKKQQNKIEAYPGCFGKGPKLSFHF